MNRKKTVLFIMDYAAPYRGNFIPSILNLAGNAGREGLGVVFLFPEAARNIEWVIEFQKEHDGVYFIDRSFFSKKIRFSNIALVRRIIRKENVRIIHTHFVAYNYSLLLLKILLRGRVSFIGNFMNEFLPARNKWFRIKVLVTRQIFDLIIASSDGVKKSIINAGIPDKYVTTVFNSLDPGHLEISEKVDFRVEPGESVILMFGWTYKRKGVDIAVKAINELVGTGKKIRLVVAMAGGFDIVENGIREITGTLPGWITLKGPAQNIASYYNASDIFLSSSREEGFTYSVLEAAYCSPMLIMSRIEGHPLDLPFSESFEGENVEELKKTILKVLSFTADERKMIRKAQKEYVLSVYDVNKWSGYIIKEYLKFLK
jgi:glycosyltransferase involved in cell wall biosynthesis